MRRTLGVPSGYRLFEVILWVASLARSRDPFGTVLAALRQRIGDGRYAPGQPLAIVELAQEFEFSTTPVREALAWLAGEGVIQERRGAGYSCWRVELGDLRDLYDLHEGYMLLALERASLDSGFVGAISAPSEEAASPTLAPLDHVRSAAARFGRIVEASRQEPLIRAHASLTTRLGNVRRAEAHALSGLAEELVGIREPFEPARTAETVIRKYHARRRNHSADIHHHLVDDRIYSA